MQVTKANGTLQPFSEEKLINSIRRAGIPQDLQDQVLSHVKTHLRDTIPTSEIYQHITEFLEQKHPYGKTLYSLKRAIMELGPTGHPFEDFAARLLETQGYQTIVRSTLIGKCISHEIDIIADKEQQKVMVEAKFHNTSGIKTDVQVALYTQARFEDVEEKYHFTKPGLITNTKPTTDAIAYAECVGMKLMAWDYPHGGSIRDIINTHKLYPITAIGSLSQMHKQELLDHGIVIAGDLCKDEAILQTLDLSPQERQAIMTEINTVCSL